MEQIKRIINLEPDNDDTALIKKLIERYENAGIEKKKALEKEISILYVKYMNKKKEI